MYGWWRESVYTAHIDDLRRSLASRAHNEWVCSVLTPYCAHARLVYCTWMLGTFACVALPALDLHQRSLYHSYPWSKHVVNLNYDKKKKKKKHKILHRQRGSFYESSWPLWHFELARVELAWHTTHVTAAQWLYSIMQTVVQLLSRAVWPPSHSFLSHYSILSIKWEDIGWNE